MCLAFANEERHKGFSGEAAIIKKTGKMSAPAVGRILPIAMPLKSLYFPETRPRFTSEKRYKRQHNIQRNISTKL